MNPHSILTEFDAWFAWELRQSELRVKLGIRVVTEIERMERYGSNYDMTWSPTTTGYYNHEWMSTVVTRQ